MSHKPSAHEALPKLLLDIKLAKLAQPGSAAEERRREVEEKGEYHPECEPHHASS